MKSNFTIHEIIGITEPRSRSTEYYSREGLIFNGADLRDSKFPYEIKLGDVIRLSRDKKGHLEISK